jgi:hypothetical protein
MIKNLSDELIRLPIGFALVVALLWGDGTLPILGFVAGMLGFLALASHILRRVLFHYVKLSSVISKACESPAGAGIVVASILGFTAVLLSSAVQLLHAIPGR